MRKEQRAFYTFMITFPLTAILAVLLVIPAAGRAAARDGCIDCHASESRMKGFGFPQFTITAGETKAQTGMQASCEECHLGDPEGKSKEEAHKGLLSLRLVDRKGHTPARGELSAEVAKDWPSLEPRGKNRATQLGPKRIAGGEPQDLTDLRAIIYHDKNPGTLAFSPSIALKTCGKCHPDQVKGFLKTAMGGARGAHTQSQYVYWTSPTGPQSCGLWVGALAQPDQERFATDNVEIFNRHSTAAVPRDVAFAMQKNCNLCHVGCLDCHYSPRKKDAKDPHNGPHTFTGKPDALTCYGGGRSFSCHAGPLERRRGDGYLRGEFTQATAAGKKILSALPDIHAQKGLACTACHENNGSSGGHADLKRSGECATCHPKAVADHATGMHRKVDCAGCHTALIGGYAFNFWTRGGEPGKENPVTRIQDYLVDAMPPVLVKNPGGIWMPMHVVPHTSGNIKAAEVKLSKRLLFRNRPDAAVDRHFVSNDAFAVTGLVKDPDGEDRDIMVWLNLDRVAHGLGKSRPCKGCHGSTAQKVTTRFNGGSYRDVEEGSYTIVADEKGLRVTDIKGPDGGPAPTGLAPFRNKWGLRGNFALPKTPEKNLYLKIEKSYEAGAFEH